MVFSGRQGARTYVECHDGQPSAAGLHPSPIVISPLWQTNGKTIRKNGSAEKWRKCGIVGNCLRWLRSWGLGKSVAERRAADKNGSALQCTIWDRESFRNYEDKIQRYAKTKTNTKIKTRAADKNGSAQQCTIWDRESFPNDEDEIQRHAKTKICKDKDKDKSRR